jgi:hypothetical protein
MERRTLIWTLATAAIIANLADALTTFIALTYFELGELNPVMAFLYQSPVGYFIKLVVVSWFLLPLPYCPLYKTFNHKNRYMQWAVISGLIFATLLFGLAAMSNVWYILNAL